MLVGFTVCNFRSFNLAECFSMEAGKTRSFSDRVLRAQGTKLLKFKAIYGANASGKSSLVKAIDFMRRTVTSRVPAESSLDYCRLDEANANKPSLFEMEILLGDRRFTYGFEILLNIGTFVREWMSEQRGNKKRLVFERSISSGEYTVDAYINDDMLNERLRIYAEDVKNDGSVLFLSLMNQNKDALYVGNSPIKVYQLVYRWFKNKLSVNHPNEPITYFTYFFDSEGSEKAQKLLTQLDTGIAKVQICEEPTDRVIKQISKNTYEEILDGLNDQKKRNATRGSNEAPAIMLRSDTGDAMYLIEMIDDELRCKTLRFNHQHSNTLFDLRDESDGTIRLMHLLEILLSRNSNMVYVIDEVSRCLHPRLTKKFVNDFLQMASERNIQLIVTTHEAELMDLELVRQDEIGFVGKKEDGTTKVFGLDGFGARFDKRIRKAYIEGEYGGVPEIH